MVLSWFSETFHLAFRQEWAIAHALEMLKSVTADGGFSVKKLFAALLMCVQAFNFLIFETPLPATGQELDLTGYELVFCDQFDADTLDTDVWRYRGQGARRSGFNSAEQVKLEDGNLVITAEYREDGPYGEGWYVGAVALREWYCRGYFEIRCMVTESEFWSAFWIQAEHPYSHELSGGGVYGAEIDIFEAMSAKEKLPLKRNAVVTTIHCNGWDDDAEKLDSRILGEFRANDIYNTYNTYGVEWTEDEYIFYINGVETTRSSFAGGVSTVPEELIVSVECPTDITSVPGDTSRMVVDYVKIYQKP